MSIWFVYTVSIAKVTDYTLIHLYAIFGKAHVSVSIKTKTHNHFVYAWVYKMKHIADTAKKGFH